MQSQLCFIKWKGINVCGGSVLEARASQTAASLLPSSEAGLTSQGTPHPTLPHLHQQKPRDPWREGSLMHSAQSAPHPTFTLPGPPSACLDAFPAHVYLEPSFLGSLLSMLQGHPLELFQPLLNRVGCSFLGII